MIDGNILVKDSSSPLSQWTKDSNLDYMTLSVDVVGSKFLQVYLWCVSVNHHQHLQNLTYARRLKKKASNILRWGKIFAISSSFSLWWWWVWSWSTIETTASSILVSWLLSAATGGWTRLAGSNKCRCTRIRSSVLLPTTNAYLEDCGSKRTNKSRVIPDLLKFSCPA